MKIYLSGPMTGLPNYNHDEFNRVASDLREAGHEVFNPAEIVLEDEPINDEELWQSYMRVCITNLPDCDKVVVLDGWQDSRGASLEVKIARQLGMGVVHIRDMIHDEQVGAG